MKKLSLLALFAFCFLPASMSQKAPVVFGKVSIEDLKMKSYDQDTSAPAVILADYGWFDLNTFQFTRTLRVKILKKSGYYLADFKYRSMSKPAIRGVTYNLDGDKIVKEKLTSESLFFKKLGTDDFQTSFALPGIREGSVFDVEIRYQGLPYEWSFQSTVPVKISELSIPRSTYLEFNTNFTGYIPLTVSTTDRWVSKDVPAFKSEPYISSTENFISKFEIELRAITIPGYFKTYSTTWEAVNQVLLSDMSFPAEKQVALCLSSVVDKLKESGKTGEELMKDAFEAAKKMRFNGENSIYASEEGLCNHLKLESGNSADVNFTLLQILKKLDFEVYPVALSTRANGLLSQFTPSINKLNYIIVAVKTDDGFILLDATEKNMPWNLLPPRVINGNGRIISNKYSQWIPLVSKAKEASEYKYDLTLNDDMTLTGTVTEVLTDYAAWLFRDNYQTFNSKEEYARQLEKENPGLIINDITITDAEDIYKPVTITSNVTIDGMATMADNEIYITPMLFDQLKESPFNAAERVYPISYSRLLEKKVNVRIQLSEKYAVSILPKPATSKTKKNEIAFTYSVNSSSNVIEAAYVFNINSLTILQDQYKDVRNVYNNLVSKHAEPVILKVQ